MDVILGEKLEPEMADEVEQVVDVDPAPDLKVVDIRHDEGRVYPTGSPTAREKIEQERDYKEKVRTEPTGPKRDRSPDPFTDVGLPRSDIIQCPLRSCVTESCLAG